MNLLNVMLAAAPAQGGSGWGNIVLIVLMVVVFYFFMIRPQQKKQKEIRKFQEAIAVGTEVITAGGILGKIKEVKENYVIVEIDDNVRIRVQKSSVYAIGSPEANVKK